MSTEIEIEFLWIPHKLGGHRGDPYLGMRATIRWQRYIREYVEHSRDVECTSLALDRVSGLHSATLRLVSPDPAPAEWVLEHNLIELLDGYRVIAVGRIVAAQSAAE
jgi:hypothetical protein